MSAPNGHIAARSAERYESREDHIIPVCWEQAIGPTPPEFPCKPLLTLNDSKLPPAWPKLDAGDALLAMLAPQAPACLLHAIDDALGRGVHVYVLATPEMDVLGQRQRAPQGRLLVRRVRELPSSALLAQRGRHAGICLSPSAEVPPRYFLPLSQRQGELLFAACRHLFWEHAIEEACLSEGSLRFAPPLPAPFTSPLATDPCVSLRREPFPLCEGPVDLCYLPSGELPPDASKLRTLLSPAGGTYQNELASLCRGGIKVAWRNLYLPAIYLGAGEGGLLLGNKGWRLRIRLEPDQVAGLRQQLEAAVAGAEYTLRIETRLRELQGAVWLPDTAQAEQPSAQVALDAGIIAAATLAEVSTREPSSWPSPPELARKVRYHFVVQPPRAPSGAKPDPIVKEWYELDQRFDARCNRLSAQLANVEQHESSLGKAFARLSAALLGHGKVRGQLGSQLARLADSRPSACEPDGALALLDELTSLEQEAAALAKDLKEDERKAREQEEREQQEEDFRQRQKKAQSELGRGEAEQKKLQQALIEIKKQLSDSAAEKDPDADGQVRRQKLEDKQQQLDRELADLDGKCALNREIIEEKFAFQPTNTPTLRPHKPGKGALFVPPEKIQSAAEQVPREALPRTGILLRHKQQRFVVIDQWKELELGQKEAARLNAQLVAPTEAQ